MSGMCMGASGERVLGELQIVLLPLDTVAGQTGPADQDLTSVVVMTYIEVMYQVNEVKAKFAEYLDRAARGERIVIYRYNKPVAELRPITSVRTSPRPIGPIEGRPTFDVPPSFFEPLDDGELAAWEGASSADAEASAFPAYVPDTTSKVAESAPAIAEPRRPKRRRP